MNAHNKCSKCCLSAHMRALSLFLHSLMVASITLLQTARHQQGAASAHWCNKIYPCSSQAGNCV